MILVPIGTDAPLYHYPITTGLLIVVNCICFLVTGAGDPIATTPWVLEFGHINPLEWLSSMFAHASIGHLVGNMLFLWSFGLIVEGKLGWFRTLAVYMLIGLTQAALIQLIMLPLADSGGALGASSTIMGLMAISLIWAPKNDLQMFFFIWVLWYIRVKVIDVSVMTFAILYLSWDLLMFALLDQGRIGTSALHLSGAALGLVVGIVTVKKGWVDCENWDLFSVLAGRSGREADRMTAVGSHADPMIMFGHNDVAVKDDLPDNSRRTRNTRRLQQIRQLIENGDFLTAHENLLELRMLSDTPVDAGTLKKLIRGLVNAEMFEEAEMYLEEYIELYPDSAIWARLQLAAVLLQQQRPRAAYAALKGLPVKDLTASQKQKARQLVADAKRMVADGIQDAEPEW